MADTDWNLHSKQLITPVDDSRMLLEPSDETAKAVEVGGFRTWLMNTALFNTLTTTAKNIIGAIEEVKEIADSNTSQLNDIMNEKGYSRAKRFEIETDLNTLYESGIYCSSNFINAPTDNVWFICEVFNMTVEDSSEYYCVQRIMGIANGGTTTYERRCNNGVWTNWNLISCYDTEPSLVNGWGDGLADMGNHIAINGNTVTLNLAITGGDVTEGTPICYLPETLRPTSHLILNGVSNFSKSTVEGNMHIEITQDGKIAPRNSGWNSTDTYIISTSYCLGK